MSIPAFFNKIALRSTQSDSSPSYVEENNSGDLTLKSGSNKIKLLGDVEYQDNGEFVNLKTKIDELSLGNNGESSSDIDVLNVELDSSGTHPFALDENLEDFFTTNRVINLSKGVYYHRTEENIYENNANNEKNK